jgi:hypothetical protein
MKPLRKNKTQTAGGGSAPRPRGPAPSAPKRKQPSHPLNRIPKKPPQGVRSGKLGPAPMAAGAITQPHGRSGRVAKAATKAFHKLDTAIRKSLKQFNVMNRDTARHLRRKVVPLLWKMRKQHFAQGQRQPLPGFATWEEYCDDIGIKADTARDWFQKFIPAKRRKKMPSHAARQRASSSAQPGSASSTQAPTPTSGPGASDRPPDAISAGWDGVHNPDIEQDDLHRDALQAADYSGLLDAIGARVDKVFKPIKDDAQYAATLRKFSKAIAERHHRSMKIEVTPEVN